MDEMEKVPEAPRRSEPAYSFVIYDAKMGQVVQVHHFGAMPGVELPSKENLSEMALRHAASRHKRDISSMEILEIDAPAIQPKTTYRVSLSDRTLVEEPPARAT